MPASFPLEHLAAFLTEVQRSIWLDALPLQASVFQCLEPLPIEMARQQTYTPVEPGWQWGPTWSTAWFRLEGAYPAEWAGETVAAVIDTGSEALVWSENGPLQGLDANRRDVMLAAPALGAGMVDFFVEAAANPAFGQEYNTAPAPFTFGGAQVARFNPAAWNLYHDLFVLFDLAKSLPLESGRRVQLLAAISTALNHFRRGGGQDFAAARACLTPEFAKPAEASFSCVNAVAQSHIDTAWLWPIRETIRKCARTFSTVLAYQEIYPEYRYLQSQPQLYLYMKTHYPTLYTRIKEAVAAGRWEPEGTMWVEPDCNLPSGESLIRQFLYGKRFFREEFGVENTVLWLMDAFGYTGALPQIMRGCGVNYFLTTKMSWNTDNPFPYHSFWWEGIDGTRVLAHQTPMFGSGDAEQVHWLLQGERRCADKDRAGTWLYPFGFGDGGGGPTKGMLEVIRRLENLEGVPPTQMRQRVGDWFTELEVNAHNLPVWAGELYLERHRGTFTTVAMVKQENRRCEVLLREAELLATLSPDHDYPHAALDDAWRLLLLNQFHDILPGSSIHPVYEDAAKDFAAIHEITEGIIEAKLAKIGAAINTSRMTNPMLAMNTLGFSRDALVTLPWMNTSVVGITHDGTPLRTQSLPDGLLVELRDLPSVGYVTFDLQAGENRDGPCVTATPTTLENSLLRAEFNSAGELISMYDKRIDRELLCGVGNRFERLDERGMRDDAWEIATPAVDADVLTTPGSVTVVEVGPLRATLRVERTLTPHATLVQYIRLTAHGNHLDFDTEIDWQEEQALLKVAFPIDLYVQTAYYETQFGHIERPTHRNTSWDAAKFEVPGHRWAALSEPNYTVALCNNGKYGYDVHGHVLRLSLLRSTTHPDPYADRGLHRFTYSLVLHPGNLGDGTVMRAACALNVPTHVMPLTSHAGAWPASRNFITVTSPALMLETVKRAENDDSLVLRCYEACRTHGQAVIRFESPLNNVVRTNLCEDEEIPLSFVENCIPLAYRPFEIITLKIRA